MKTEEVLLIVWAVVVLAILVWECVYFSNMKRGYYCEYKGHKIEFKLRFGKALLFVDGQECDRQSTVLKWVVVLKTQIDEEAVELRMTSGLFKPVLKLFVGSEQYALKKNLKEKKNGNN